MAGEKSNGPLLAVFFTGGFLAGFNANVVSVALPGIMADLAVDASTAQWLVSGYMMMQAVVITLYPFLSRRFSTRVYYLVGLALFALGQLGCMLAPSFAVLAVFRVLQACGGGLLIPVMMGASLMLAPEGKASTYLAAGTACLTVGPALAPVVSGVLVTAFSWRACFTVPLAVALAMSLAGAFVLRPLAEIDPAASLDPVSLVLAALTLVAFVYGMGRLAQVPVVGIAALVVSVVFGALFGRRQSRLDQPYLSVAPLKTGLFTACCAILIISIMQNFSMSLLLPLQFQSAFGRTAMEAGLLVIPPILVMTVATVLSGRLADRFGVWPLVPAGFTILLVGQVLVFFSAGAGSLAAIVGFSTLVYGGAGLVQAPLQALAIKSLPPEESSSGVSLVNVCIQMAAAIGPALFVGVLSSASARAALGGADAVAAQTAGFAAAIVVAAVLACIGLIASVPVSRKGERR